MHVSIRISRNEFSSSIPVIKYTMKLKISEICVILYSSYIQVLKPQNNCENFSRDECYYIIAKNITVIFRNNSCYLLD